MGGKYTEDQKRATYKYLKKLSSISIRVKPEIAARYKKAADDSGMSLREYILTALEEKISRDSKNS